MPVVWLAQSCFSFLQGASTPQEIYQESFRQGHDGVCLSDFDGLYGAVRLWRALRQEPELAAPSPLRQRIFHASQLQVDFHAPSPEAKKLLTALQAKEHLPVFLQNRLSLIPLDHRGYTGLCSLVSYAHREGKKAIPLPLSDSPWPRHVAALLPMRGLSCLFSPRQRDPFTWWLSRLALLRECFPGPFFLALTPPSSPLERNAWECHREAHLRLGIPLLATEDVFFHTPERKPIHDLLNAVRCNATLTQTGWAHFPNSARTLHSRRVVEEWFASRQLTHAWNASRELADSVNFSLDELRYQYPSEFIPAGESAISFLEKMVRQALQERFPSSPPTSLLALVEKELVLVAELGFADYFLTVWDIVRFARSQGILCQGRGSAANSAICFLLGITAVDPMVSDVLFERFISRERGEPPDIDVDFEHERREEVIQYIYERYGRTRAAMVANVITFRTKGALRATGKALGVDDATVSRMFTALRDPAGRQRPFVEILEDGNARAEAGLSTHLLGDWATLAETLHGFPRHLGIHSGGFVVSQNTLHELSPVEPATMEGRSVVQWSKDDIEALGFFKIDVLALGMLTALRKSFDILRQRRCRIPGTLKPVSLGTIPPDCRTTYRMIQNAQTMGVFQIESRAQMAILPKILPREFYDLVVSIGIVRPGPIVSGMVTAYVARRTGREAVVFPHERLRPILARTMGVPVFQEQVMRVAMAVADFTPGEADELRRAMGAWKLSGDMRRFETRLRAGMRKNGIADEFADIVYKQIEGFSEYGFPESHATSFAHLAYASAWLKAHFPAEFLCGLLNSQPLGFYSIHSLIQEARHGGVQVHEPCLWESEWDSHVNRAGEVQLGLRLVALLRPEGVTEFTERRVRFAADHSPPGIRAQGKPPPFETILFEMLNCFQANELVALAMSGAFRRFDENRRNVLWRILATPSRLLCDNDARRFAPKPELWEAWDDMRDDYRYKGTTLGEHPMSLLKKLAWPFAVPLEKLIPAATHPQVPHGRMVICAGLAIIRQSPPTAKGMTFITLEDETGSTNLVIQPHVHQRFREELLASDLLCVEGRKEDNGQSPAIVVRKVYATKISEGGRVLEF